MMALAVLFAGLLIVSLVSVNWYNNNLKPVTDDQSLVHKFSVQEGWLANEVADRLAEVGLIRSASAFKIYIRLNGAAQDLQAGNFELKPSWRVSQIVEHLSSAIDEDHLEVTILPGRRLDQLADDLRQAGFSATEVDQALLASSHPEHQVHQYLPAGASLEGYIFPETFFVDRQMTATGVVRLALDQFVEVVERQNLEAAYQEQGLSLHQAVIMASIVEREVGESHRPTVAQVFLKRWRQGTLLGADATFIYAAVVSGGQPSPSLDNPYNTRLYPGLPPGPISNVDLSALKAVAFPAQTDYFFFVAGDDGNIYFNQTLEGHLRDAQLYCHELCELPSADSID